MADEVSVSRRRPGDCGDPIRWSLSTGRRPVASIDGGNARAPRENPLGQIDHHRAMNKVRQTRIYLDKPVSKDDLGTLLEVAQWTAAPATRSRGTSSWCRTRKRSAKLAALRSNIDWVANVPWSIALVFDGKDTVLESFDEGRIFERLAIGAKLLGLAAGTAWFPGEGRSRRPGTARCPRWTRHALHGRARLYRQGRQPAPRPQLRRPQTARGDRQLRDDVDVPSRVRRNFTPVPASGSGPKGDIHDLTP